MPGNEDVIIHSFLNPWNDPIEYPNLRSHFTASELAKLDAFKTQTSFTVADKLFFIAMVSKAIFVGST